MVAHACNPGYLGGRKWEDTDLRLAQANSLWDPHLQNNQSKMDWKYSSSGTVPALQGQSLKIKPQSH
jgi:hypothetical protein